MKRIPCYVIVLSICIVTISSESVFDLMTRGDKVSKLDIFERKSESDMIVIKKLFCMVSDVEKLGDHNEAYNKLAIESCSTETKKIEVNQTGHIMCTIFKEFNSKNSCVPHLMQAECAAVYMYTSEFYNSIDQNMHREIWKPYKTFITLLYSALKKLSKHYPVADNTILYRGLGYTFTSNYLGRLYFKQFVITSLSRDMADDLGKDTMLIFEPQTPIVAGKLMNMTKYHVNQDQVVILSPFEGFDIIKVVGYEFHLKTSTPQDLIDDQNTCKAEGLKAAFITIMFSILALVTSLLM